MVTYIKSHDVMRVVVLEISRLGRNTLEALKVIQVLNENGVSLHIKNYNLNTLNPDGKPNPVTSLITTILLEIAQMERLKTPNRSSHIFCGFRAGYNLYPSPIFQTYLVQKHRETALDSLFAKQAL